MNAPTSVQPPALNITPGCMAWLACAVAASGGVLLALVPAAWLAWAGLACCGLLLAARAPFAGLILGLCLLFEVIPAQFQPTIALVHGSIKLIDLWFACLACVLLPRVFRHPRLQRAAFSPFHWCLLLLLVLTLVSLVYSICYASNKAAISEARELALWLILPMLAYAIEQPRQLSQFVSALVGIGLGLSALALLQSFSGMQFAAAMRVAPLSPDFLDVTRVIAGGGTYLTGFAIIYLVLQSFSSRRALLWRLPLLLFLGAGLALSFGRGMWVATVIGLLAAVWFAQGWRGLVWTGAGGAALTTVLLAGLFMFKPAVVHAVVDRAAGLGQEISGGASFKWRAIENREALRAIGDHPVLGVGIGGEYKKFATSDANFDIEKRYLHNAYLNFPVKLGIAGLLFPLLMVFCFFRLAVAWWRTPGHQRLLGCAAIGGFVVPLLTSFTQPEWVRTQGIAALCCLIAVLCLDKSFAAAGHEVET